jgi:hypothetical protein
VSRQEGYNPLLKSYPDSVKVNQLTIGAETLYTRLLAASDDAGRYFGDAEVVLAKLFTFRMARGEVNAQTVEKWLCELESVSLAARYRNGSVTYLELATVFKKLRKDVKPQVRFPAQVEESVPERIESETPRSESVPLEPTQTNPNQNQTNPRAVGAVTDPNMIPIPVPIDTPEFRASWDRWVEHLRQKGQRPSQLTLADSLIDLNNMGLPRAIAALAYSIRKGYVGIFEEKTNQAPGPRPISKLRAR